jgi:succinate dehydrogenase / fumarate reductase cytochrome b subunit
MTPVSRLLASSIGMKIVMAVTGGLLSLFLVAHVLGNLEIFAGAEAINRYGALLRVIPWMLWVVRAGLLTLIVLHVWSAANLLRINAAARPQPYKKRRYRATNWAARAMLLSGAVVAAFVVFHILHFTVCSVVPAYKTLEDLQGRHDVFAMVSDAFHRPGVAAFYVVAMLLLGLHLSHGVASALQTLGLNHPRYNPSIRFLGPLFAALIVLGFIAVPLAVLSGAVHP